MFFSIFLFILGCSRCLTPSVEACQQFIHYSSSTPTSIIQPSPPASTSHIMAVPYRSLAFVALALASSASAQSADCPSSNSSASSSSTTSSGSVSTVLSSLILNLIIFAAEIAAFIILRPRFPKVYRPKTYLGLHEERVAPLSDSLFGWIPQFIKTPTTEILYKNGLDAYQFVAFCEMMVSGSQEVISALFFYWY